MPHQSFDDSRNKGSAPGSSMPRTGVPQHSFQVNIDESSTTASSSNSINTTLEVAQFISSQISSSSFEMAENCNYPFAPAIKPPPPIYQVPLASMLCKVRPCYDDASGMIICVDNKDPRFKENGTNNILTDKNNSYHSANKVDPPPWFEVGVPNLGHTSQYSPFDKVFVTHEPDFGEIDFRRADSLASSSLVIAPLPRRASNMCSNTNVTKHQFQPTSSAVGFVGGSTDADTNRRKAIMGMDTWRTKLVIPKNTKLRVSALKDAANVPAHVQAIAAAVQEEREERVSNSSSQGVGRLEPFKPSYSTLQRFGLITAENDVRSRLCAVEYGNSERYLGDAQLAHNRAANIPDEENCALWVMGLPANVTYNTLLGSIRNVGKVFATVINPADGDHATAAAKVVFFTRAAAERLMIQAQSDNFQILGKIVNDVRWNKIRSGPYQQTERSRAIRITGPQRFMSFDYFEVFFTTRFTYELDKKVIVPCSAYDKAAHEWHFGSLRCQAASAKLAIEREHGEIFQVEWATDPCEFP